MDTERLQQIEDLYQRALKLGSTERAAFLRDACGNDDSLRRPIEALFALHAQAESFIESPAPIAISMLEDRKEKSLVGQS